MSPSIEIQNRLSNLEFSDGFRAGIAFADAQSTPHFQKLWARVMKAENWTPSDAVNYYVGMNKPETTPCAAIDAAMKGTT